MFSLKFIGFSREYLIKQLLFPLKNASEL